MHLFITIEKGFVSFRANYGNKAGQTVAGSDPVKNDTETLAKVIHFINHYGDGCTVEIRDDRK